MSSKYPAIADSGYVELLRVLARNLYTKKSFGKSAGIFKDLKYRYQLVYEK